LWEELNGSNPESTLAAGDLSNTPIVASQIDAELSNWIDNSIEHSIDNFADFDLNSLDGSQPGESLAIDDDDFAGLELALSIDNGLEINAISTEDFADFDLNFLNGSASIADLSDIDIPNDRPQLSSSSDDDFTDLDLNPLGHNSLNLNLSAIDDLIDLDVNSDRDKLDSSAINRLTDLDIDSPESNHSDSSVSSDLEFSDLALNVKNIDELSLNSADANIFTDLSLDLDLEMLGNSEQTLDTFTDRNLGELNFTSLTDLKSSAAVDAELPIDPNVDIELNDATFDVVNDSDFANLDINFGDDNSLTSDELLSSEFENISELDFNLDELGTNVLNDRSLTSDELLSSEFENISELDFNLDELSTDLSSHELTDLESMLEDSSLESLPQHDDSLTNAGDLDALVGLTALGIGGAALAGNNAAFADLDALVEPNPAAEPVGSLDDLDRLLDVPTPVANPPAQNTDKKSTDRRAKQSRTFEQTMRVSVRHLDNLNNLVGELVVNRNTLEQDQNRMRQFVEKLLSEVQKLNEVGKRMQDLYERSLMENSLIASRQQYKPTITPNTQIISENLGNSDTLMEYDPLEMDRFTPIHLLSQKMIELTVRVRESTADIEFVVDGSTEVTRTLRQITGQLQEDLTKSRMVPFAQTADRLQRGVRDNGLKYGKQIELNVEGRDTPIDKVILESLTEPLIHMVNNAIAHGIESTESRQAAGKPSEGKITIRALHQGNQTIISISDDGAGIDTERVKTKAIEKGVITAGQASTMSKAEIYELLFLPSFSTKDQADELSGRGVGMDVVRTSITEIRGTITTESQLGVGTTFTIRLPLALSIAKALIAVNNKSNIAFPMDGIEDTQDVSPEQIQTNSEGEQCIFWRDRLMPFKPLSDLLAFNRPLARNNFYTNSEDDSDLVSILILRSDGNLMAIQVDKITGDQEIVIKPLQGPAAKPLGIAGATVLGDGRIIPIADVMELIALANGTLARHVSAQWTDRIAAPTVELRESMVLIVDDSITVRELLSLTFKRAGYRVEQARDGQEAWDKLRAGLPCDIVFCDIEMPRMDGLEFLSRIQKDVALSKVPIAMLTSRGSDRHRQIASQLGASGYFIKPYLEEALLDAAKRMIKGEVLEIV
jgi:chemotaxis protein histidine kinase CheA/ActR/RegA family two-component response regulator